jgi:restriction endonuclease S subunit
LDENNISNMRMYIIKIKLVNNKKIIWFYCYHLKNKKRIVAKVDQLMALCDELEAGLVQMQTDGGKLMEAVVHN